MNMVAVEKGCASCRRWQEHYYWEHMDDVTKIRFFRLMTGDFTQGISIPAKFVKNFNGQITNDLGLKVPSGETWHVGVDMHGDELLLKSGWSDFVKAHDLKENDLLIFTCRGNSKFDILIFETSGCEKLSSLFANKICPDLGKHLNDLAGQHAEPYTQTDSEEATMTPNLGGCHMAFNSRKYNCKTKPTKESESLNSSSYHVKHEAIEEEESDDNRYADSKFYFSRAANQLQRKRRRAFSVWLPSNQKILHLWLFCRRTIVNVVPSTFAADHLQERTEEIILCRPSRKDKWFVRYYYTRVTRGFKYMQFFKFVYENKLREGDTCVFELMKGAKRVTMTVHVIRKINDRFVLVRSVL